MGGGVFVSWGLNNGWEINEYFLKRKIMQSGFGNSFKER